MSKIPFNFQCVPSFFRENGWFRKPNCVAFVTWAFSRCTSERREICHDGIKVILNPYQFIFGRRICSEETGLTEDQIRTQQMHLENAGFLIKTPNRNHQKFTIYEWVTTAFSQTPQRNPQQNPQRNPQPNDGSSTIVDEENENQPPTESPTKPPTKPPTDPHNIDKKNTNQEEEEEKGIFFKDQKEFLRMIDLAKSQNFPFTESKMHIIAKETGFAPVVQALQDYADKKFAKGFKPNDGWLRTTSREHQNTKKIREAHAN